MSRTVNKTKRMYQNRWLSALCGAALLAILFSLSLSIPNNAQAQPFPSEDARTDTFFSQPAGISRKEAARRARAATDGKVIAIKPDKQGKSGYNVRLVVDGGRVVTVRVDQSGKVHR